MVVRPRVVSYPPIDSFVRIASAFCPELPYGPVVAVFGVEEGDEAIERVAVGSLWVRLARPGAMDGDNVLLACSETRALYHEVERTLR